MERRGLWRCENCGDAYQGVTDTRWRWAGTHPAHACGGHPQAGHFAARWDGPDPPSDWREEMEAFLWENRDVARAVVNRIDRTEG